MTFHTYGKSVSQILTTSGDKTVSSAFSTGKINVVTISLSHSSATKRVMLCVVALQSNVAFVPAIHATFHTLEIVSVSLAA